MKKNIQLIGKIKDNPNWKTQFQLATDLIKDAWKRFNLPGEIQVINPADWDTVEHHNNIANIRSIAEALKNIYQTDFANNDSESNYLAYSIISLMNLADYIMILPNIQTSLGSGAEILVARRLKIPPIILLPTDKTALQETIAAYLTLRLGDKKIKILYEPTSNRLIIESRDIPNAIDLSPLTASITDEDVKQAIVQGSVKDLANSVISQSYYFVFNPNHISYMFHWELTNVFPMDDVSL